MEQTRETRKRLDKGEVTKNAAEEYSVGSVTNSDWKSWRREIDNWYSARASNKACKKGKQTVNTEFEWKLIFVVYVTEAEKRKQ